MRNIMAKATSVGVVCLLLACGASATTLTIRNEDTANLNIVVEPGQGTITPSTPSVKQAVKPGEEISLAINRELLDNAEVFSIRGSGAVVSPNGKCGPLLFTNDYKIVFVSGKLGTVVCTYEVQ